MLPKKNSLASFTSDNEQPVSTNNSPNNESIKSFKEFRTMKLLKNRDFSGSSEETEVYNDDAYNLLTYNENLAATSPLPDSSAATEEVQSRSNRRSYHSIYKRSSANSDLYSIFNGKNRLSIAIFSDTDCVSIKDDATMIELAEESDDNDDDDDDEFDDVMKPLRRYNSHESILSNKKVLDLEPEKLTFNPTNKNLDSLYLGSFTKREEKFKRSFDYLRNGQLSYLTSAPMTGLNDRKAITTTTNKIMDSNTLISPFMLTFKSRNKKSKMGFKTSDNLREHLTPFQATVENGNSKLQNKSTLINVTTTKVDETIIDFETKTIKRKSSIIWDLPKRNSNSGHNANTSQLTRNPFINPIPKRQPSLKITRKGEAVIDNGTEVYSSDVKLDLLRDALSDV